MKRPYSALPQWNAKWMASSRTSRTRGSINIYTFFFKFWTQIDQKVRLSLSALNIKQCSGQGRNRVILRERRWYIYDRKVEIRQGLWPSVKCVAPLIRDMSLAKVWNAGGGARPPTPPPPPPQLRPWLWANKNKAKKYGDPMRLSHVTALVLRLAKKRES